MSLVYICISVYCSEFGVYQPASVTRNEFRDNSELTGRAYTVNRKESAVSGYTLALRGVQKVIFIFYIFNVFITLF